MRLHRLQARAFGPFAELIEVDFDELADAGIFLIHGATGSGKTSLLDAVCFALYGRVPGLRPAGETLRSDHAGADDVPEVTLELTVGNRRLRVTRSPDHHRPKKRGNGLTPVRGQVRLDELSRDGVWTTLATRADDVGDSLGQALGMGLDQFAKVVLLPQGDFAAFLRATPEERRVLLERLFDVSRYTGVEAWLTDRRRLTAATAAEARATLSADLLRVDDVLARVPAEVIDGLPTWAEATDTGRLAEVAAEASTRVGAHALAALTAAATAEQAASAAESAHATAALTARAAARGEAARRVLADFAAGSDARAAAARRLELGERAGRVAGDLRALAAAEAERDSAHTRYAASRTALARWSVDVGDSPQEALSRARDLDATLDVLAQRGAAEATRTQRQASVSAQREVAQRALATIDAAEAALVEQVAQLQVRADALLTIAAGSGPAEASASQAGRLVTLRDDLDRTAITIASLESAGLAATRVALAQAGRLLDLRQRRLDGMAAELAAGLHPGDECPVCGGTEHPAPATAVDAVTAADVDAAEEAWRPLDDRVRRIETDLAAARAHHDLLVEQLGGDERDLAILRDAADVIGRAVAVAASAVAELPQVQAELAQRRQALETLAESRRAALGQLAAAQALEGELAEAAEHDAAVVRELVARHTEGCPCADPQVPTADVPARHRRVVAALADTAAARSASDEAQRRHTEAHEATSSVCRAEGFADVVQACAAAVPAATLVEIRESIAAKVAAAAAARATVADPEVERALGAPLPDLAVLAAMMNAARGQRTAAAREHALAEQAARDIDVLSRQVVANADAAAAATRVAASTAALADVVSGLGSDNTLRMKLSAFVLAGRLERVVELANERLQRMGDGRFHLAHSDRLASGGRRSGLGLVVQDEWTGQVRDTATLSGGESFMASLALALGLADAVREESGGIDLHTLFIDEGFGSLDGESLEQVMEVLDQLQDGGRAVGVVSHVPALRDRIPAQVQVDKTRRGSTVRRVTGPAA
ncbi:MAG TPA: SMC family ATPase [Dermatophilaceae bacterium]|nr:SMC family ATPase [Dermatophilaceae bacterium]